MENMVLFISRINLRAREQLTKPLVETFASVRFSIMNLRHVRRFM